MKPICLTLAGVQHTSGHIDEWVNRAPGEQILTAAWSPHLVPGYGSPDPRQLTADFMVRADVRGQSGGTIGVNLVSFEMILEDGTEFPPVITVEGGRGLPFTEGRILQIIP